MSSEHVEVLRDIRNWMASVYWDSRVDALDAAIASLSAPQTPSEAQAERYACNGPEGTFWTDDAALANKLIGAAFDRDEWTVTDTQNPTGAAQPPSAPVGVWDLPGKWRAEVEAAEPGVEKSYLSDYWLAHLHVAEELEEALAQQPAPDGGFTAADMMDARQEGRKEAQQAAGFSAGDMADASAQGFRAGVESVQQPAAVDEMGELVGLLDEVRSHFTRDDDLPDDLLPRIDAALAAQQGDSHD